SSGTRAPRAARPAFAHAGCKRQHSEQRAQGTRRCGSARRGETSTSLRWNAALCAQIFAQGVWEVGRSDGNWVSKQKILPNSQTPCANPLETSATYWALL